MANCECCGREIQIGERLFDVEADGYPDMVCCWNMDCLSGLLCEYNKITIQDAYLFSETILPVEPTLKRIK